MNAITHWMNPALAKALGWALLHSLWQGAAIALLLALALILMRRYSATARYWAATLSLMALLVCSLVTFEWLYEPAAAGISAITETDISTIASQETTPLGLPALAEAPPENHPAVYLSYFEQHLPLLVTVWLIGVFLLSLRMLGEIAYIQHLKHYRCRAIGGEWQKKLDQMAQQMGIRRPVLLRETFRIHSPMVVGVFKQVILLPAGLLSGLSPQQMEGILAHELAHVRRYDYLANIFISIIEILLFFNPMMWWISRRAKAEREHACDDLAIAWTGDTLSFVKTLAQLEEWRSSGRPLAMAFLGSKGSVLGRIQRMLRQEDRRLSPIRALGALLGISLCFALLAFQAQPVPEPAAEDVMEQEVDAEPLPFPEAEETLADALAPEPAVMPSPEPQAEATPEASTTFVLADTIPPSEQEKQKALRKMEEEMAARELAWRKKEQELRNQQLQLERERQKAMNEKRKKLMELELAARKLENEAEMKERAFEMQETELELEEMKAEEMEQKVEMLEEELERLEESEGTSEAYKNKLKEYQQAQKDMLALQSGLQRKAIEAQQAQQAQLFEIQQAIQKLNQQRFAQEQELQSLEQDLQLRMMELQHQAQAMQAEEQIRQKEMEIKYRKMMMEQDEN